LIYLVRLVLLKCLSGNWHIDLFCCLPGEACGYVEVRHRIGVNT
jgi:hypothetical protein